MNYFKKLGPLEKEKSGHQAVSWEHFGGRAELSCYH